MSDAHESGAHEGPIKTPKQLVWTVVASFVVPIVIIIMLVNYVAFGDKPAAGTDALGPQAVAERLQRVGRVEFRDASAPVAIRTGEQVYKAACTACHSIGAWASRIGTGYDALLASAVNGKGAMPKQGGGEYSDYEIGRAVVHLVNQSGGKFDEPKPPAAAASAADGAASAPN